MSRNNNSGTIRNYTWKVACPGKVTITIDSGGANVEADKANNVGEKNIC